MTKIKIEGITEVSYARAAIEAGADLIGVVLAPSPRQVGYDKAAEITAAVKKRLPVVGVFVNTPADDVNKAAESCGLDWVQLSGDESWEYCQQIEKPLIKAIHIADDWDEERLSSHLEEGQRLLGSRAPIYLLDTFSEQKYGGTGEVFAWGIAREAAAKYPVIIAGGLDPANVGQVVAALKPWGVDVASGVESGGVKDIEKIKAFIQAVRSAG
ncbi:MAG TPA: phosphoribosylanthranilate isomerase [Dehalococcoidia bacterium]|nr:phosphoribosylanthranilate isomerase [Dehalococcoidia bacterium]